MGEKKTNISVCLLATLVLVIATVGQAMVNPTQPSNKVHPETALGVRGGSVEVWQDEFLTTEKIDPAFCQNIVVNTAAGTVSMNHTYAAWIDPSFSRMKPMSIINNGQETFSDYDLNITISYDSDMQTDFDDIRFTDQAGTQLAYYTLKKLNGVTADFLLKVPILPPGQTTLFLFYGNPSASSQSNFTNIFSWRERTKPDTMASFKATTEGAWDPDVEYGANRFLVTWEERLGPEDISIPLPHYERTIPGVIHGRSYNIDGADPVPQNNSDIDVSDPGSSNYHAENPCIAFGAGNFFVVWEENPANQPLYRYEADIKGALVTANGQVSMRFNICSAIGGQFDPQVAYDSTSNRFLVVWADLRNGGSDYDIRGRLYNSYGYAIGADFPIAYELNYQGDPWISSDNKGYFFIVYEDGLDPAIGPFSLYAYRYDWTGVRIGSRISIATGTATVDNIFPAVSYNEKTEQYLVSWNDGDVSVDPTIRDSYDGNIWGKILTRTGSVVKNNFIIEAGTSFIRTDSVPYFDTMFFIAYDGTIAGNQDMYGRLLASDGTVMTDRQELTDGSSLNVDWNNLAMGAGRIFATWEDERDLLSQYADVFGYVWRSSQSIGSLNVTSVFGQEQGLIISAQLMSVPISPEMFREWRQFFFRDTLPASSSITFDIMDENGTIPLKLNLQNGENVSDVNASCIRLRAAFTRISAQSSPILDTWNISSFVGKDIYEPSTTITLAPAQPNGNNGWYISPLTATFNVTDVDSDPWNITTYYDINGFGVQVYNASQPPTISNQRPDNYIEYWSNDSVNEELPHHRVEGLALDFTAPMITLYKPSFIIAAGNATINGSAADYSSGSGIDHVRISVNEEEIYNTDFNGESAVWFEWGFSADRGETYDIFVEVWDKAGNKIEERRTVLCPDHGLYDPGYIYLFDNPKIGPKKLLVTLGLSIAANYDTLYVVLPDVTSDAASVKFVATRVFLTEEFVFWDTTLSDGCSADLLVPFGFYEVSAYAYDSNDTLLVVYPIVTKMLILLF